MQNRDTCDGSEVINCVSLNACRISTWDIGVRREVGQSMIRCIQRSVADLKNSRKLRVFGNGYRNITVITARVGFWPPNPGPTANPLYVLPYNGVCCWHPGGPVDRMPFVKSIHSWLAGGRCEFGLGSPSRSPTSCHRAKGSAGLATRSLSQWNLILELSCVAPSVKLAMSLKYPIFISKPIH